MPFNTSLGPTIRKEHILQIISAWIGQAGGGVPLSLTQINEAGVSALTIRNQGGGGHLKIYHSNTTANPDPIFSVTDAGVVYTIGSGSGSGAGVTPGLPFANAATTGLWSPAAGTIGMAASGVDAARVTSTALTLNGLTTTAQGLAADADGLVLKPTNASTSTQSGPRIVLRATSLNGSTLYTRDFILRASTTDSSGNGRFEILTRLDSGAETPIFSTSTALTVAVGRALLAPVAFAPASTNGPVVGLVTAGSDKYELQFVGNSTGAQSAYVTLVVPVNYDGTKPITFRMYWYTPNRLGKVTWGASFNIINPATVTNYALDQALGARGTDVTAAHNTASKTLTETVVTVPATTGAATTNSQTDTRLWAGKLMELGIRGQVTYQNPPLSAITGTAGGTGGTITAGTYYYAYTQLEYATPPTYESASSPVSAGIAVTGTQTVTLTIPTPALSATGKYRLYRDTSALFVSGPQYKDITAIGTVTDTGAGWTPNASTWGWPGTTPVQANLRAVMVEFGG